MNKSHSATNPGLSNSINMIPCLKPSRKQVIARNMHSNAIAIHKTRLIANGENLVNMSKREFMRATWQI